MALDRYGNFVDQEGDDGLFSTTQSDLINIIAPTPTPTPAPTPTTTLFTNEQIAQYFANAFNLPSSSSQDLLSRVVSDYQSGNIETGQKVLADAAKYQVSDQQLASVFGVTPAQLHEFRGALPTTSAGALSTTPASTSGALSNQVTSTPVGGDKATPTGVLPTTNLTTKAIDTSGALSTVAPTVKTAVDPRLSEVKTYWEQTTGDKTYAGLTDEQISKIITDNPTNYRQAIGQAAANLNRSNTIRDAFLSIYEDPNKTSYQKAQEIKALAASSKVSPTEIANVLGFTGQDGVSLLNTFLNQSSPKTIEARESFREIYNNKDLSDLQKSQQINQLLSTN